MDTARKAAMPKGFRAAGLMLGMALGGFFDGILLHQILQWHHLLSGLDNGRFADLRTQILADGLFHAVLYVVAAAGFALLLRYRGTLAAEGADRMLLAYTLFGFGLWHVIDAVLSHWILGIHRIRMDSDMPMVWDLVWLAAFGVGVMFSGWALARRSGPPGGSGRRRAPALATLVLTAGTLTLVPPVQSSDTATLVVFRPGLTPGEAMQAVLEAGGRLVWTHGSDTVWALAPGVDRLALYRGGALLVSDTLGLAGCLDWFARPAVSSPPRPARPLPQETA